MVVSVRQLTKKQICYTTTMFSCISCSNTDLLEYRSIEGYTLFRCSYCDILITRTTDRQWKQYIRNKYSGEYTRDYEIMLPKLHKRFERHLSIIKQFASGGRLLDVGCGTGHFLKYVKETDSSWKLFGVEPSGLLRKVAITNSGVVIKNGSLDAIPFGDSYFDIITCYDVLEHSMDLKKNMRELKRVLKPGGLLFVQAPNYRSLMAQLTSDGWDWWCIPDHLLHFSYLALKYCITSAGFTMVRSFTYEDSEDLLSNVKSMFPRNYIAKALYYTLIPVFLLLERMAWKVNQGGLSVVIARK